LPAIGTATRLLAVFGDPIEHSLSPAMQNAAISALGLDYVYLAFRVTESELAQALAGVRSMGIPGVNVTIPLKQAACALVDELSDDASDAGAVNTIVNCDGRLVGHNTDGQGFVASMGDDLGLDPRGLRVCIVGSGGAARGVAVRLARQGAHSIAFAARSADRAWSLSSLVKGRCPSCATGIVSLCDREQLDRVLASSDLLINATPVGMYPRVEDSLGINLAYLPKHACVADLIYNPAETVLLREAASLGYRTMNGAGMLAHQGALALKLWTGADPDVGIMRSIVLQLGG
jgi:shikimate dehydrogenase